LRETRQIELQSRKCQICNLGVDRIGLERQNWKRGRKNSGLTGYFCKGCYLRNYERKRSLRHKLVIILANGDPVNNLHCASCGINDPLVLQIDHKKGGGRSDRRKYGSYDKMIRHYLDNYTPEQLRNEIFQFLCANCNWKKYHTQKQYPVGTTNAPEILIMNSMM